MNMETPVQHWTRLLIFLSLLTLFSTTAFADEDEDEYYGTWELVNWQVFMGPATNLKPSTEDPLAWQNLEFDDNVYWSGSQYWSSEKQHYWMKSNLPKQDANGQALLAFDLAAIEQVYFNYERIYTASDAPASRSWSMIHFPTNLAEKNTLFIQFNIPNSTEAQRRPGFVIVGSQIQLEDYLLKMDWSDLIFGFTFCILGLLVFLFFLKHFKIYPLLYFAFFAFCFGASLILNWGGINIFLKNPFFLQGIFSMLWPIGMMGFSEKIITPDTRSIFWYAKWVHTIFAMINIPIAFFDLILAADILDSLGNLLLFLDAFSIAIFLLPSLKHGDRYAKLFSLGLFVLAVSGLGTLTADYLDSDLDPFNWGVLTFILILLYLLAEMYEDSKKKLLNYSQDLEQKNRELKRLDQLKDEFIANTSHEFKTPLHGIIGLAESLKTSNTPQQNQQLSIIVSNAQRLTQLVNDVLNVAKAKYQGISLQLAPQNLSSLVDETLNILRPLADNKNLVLRNEIKPTDIVVLADKEKLQQILQNLLGNAVKFTDSGHVRIHSSLQKNQLQVFIEDTGPGIAQEQMNNLFQPFSQGDSSSTRKHGGTGLGLSIAKKLVELHQGELKVESQLDQGTKFSFCLPLTESTTLETNTISKGISKIPDNPILAPNLDQAEHNLANPIHFNSTEGSYRVLVVDDELLNQQIVQTQLITQGYDVALASSGAEALAFIEEEKPDLVLLDIMMPEMDGFEVCQYIRQQFPLLEMPILFLTAKDQIEDIVQAFQVGGNDYLTKPFSQEELLSRVNTQVQLGTAKDRLVNLRDFANQVGQHKDTDKLLESVFQIFCKEKFVESAGVFQGEKLLHTHPTEDEALQHLSERFVEQEETEILNMDGKHYLCTHIQGLGNYRMVVQKNSPFSGLDLEYSQSLIEQVSITKNNLFSLIMDPKLLEILSALMSQLNELDYIRSQDKYCEFVLEKSSQTLESHRIRLKTIKLYFPETVLMQVHRSYLVNPKKVRGIRKKGRAQYELIMSENTVPVGQSYLPTIHNVLPNLKNFG